MPSNAHVAWCSERVASLDEIEQAHARVAGTDRGRRFTTQQINRAYAVILSSQFQAFCRDLHSESVDHLINAVQPAAFQIALRAEYLLNRQLDKGNPHPGAIGSDFNRLGMVFWADVDARDARNAIRKNHLEELNTWRNAIAHHDFSSPQMGGVSVLRLALIRRWRTAANNLANTFDRVLRDHIQSIVGHPPWP